MKCPAVHQRLPANLGIAAFWRNLHGRRARAKALLISEQSQIFCRNRSFRQIPPSIPRSSQQSCTWRQFCCIDSKSMWRATPIEFTMALLLGTFSKAGQPTQKEQSSAILDFWVVIWFYDVLWIVPLCHGFPYSMVVTELGISTCVRELHPRKAPWPLRVTKLGISTCVREMQPEKAALSSMLGTKLGIVLWFSWKVGWEATRFLAFAHLSAVIWGDCFLCFTLSFPLLLHRSGVSGSLCHKSFEGTPPTWRSRRRK